MLNLTRGVVLDPIKDTKTITDAWEGQLPNKWNAFRSAVKYSLGLKRSKYTYGGMHTTTKSGPIGQSILTATLDFPNLPLSLKSDLAELGGPEFKSIIDGLDQDVDGRPVYQH